MNDYTEEEIRTITRAKRRKSKLTKKDEKDGHCGNLWKKRLGICRGKAGR